LCFSPIYGTLHASTIHVEAPFSSGVFDVASRFEISQLCMRQKSWSWVGLVRQRIRKGDMHEIQPRAWQAWRGVVESWRFFTSWSLQASSSRTWTNWLH